jgi:hypothetical protein
MLKRARLALGFIAVVCAIVGNASGMSPSGPQSPTAASDAIDVQMDTGEAEAILAIIAGQPAWDQLFQSDAYKRVKQREAGGKYAFSDDDFRRFVLSSDLQNRAPALSHACRLEEREPRQCVPPGFSVFATRSAGPREGLYCDQAAREQLCTRPTKKPRRFSFPG